MRNNVTECQANFANRTLSRFCLIAILFKRLDMAVTNFPTIIVCVWKICNFSISDRGLSTFVFARSLSVFLNRLHWYLLDLCARYLTFWSQSSHVHETNFCSCAVFKIMHWSWLEYSILKKIIWIHIGIYSMSIWKCDRFSAGIGITDSQIEFIDKPRNAVKRNAIPMYRSETLRRFRLSFKNFGIRWHLKWFGDRQRKCENSKCMAVRRLQFFSFPVISFETVVKCLCFRQEYHLDSSVILGKIDKLFLIDTWAIRFSEPRAI